MAKLTISIESPSMIPTPDSGKITVFADSTDSNKPKYKTDDGQVHEFGLDDNDLILSATKSNSDFSGTGFESEVTLLQIPAHSIVNFLMIEMDSEFMSAGFSNVKLQLLARDTNGDFNMRSNTPASATDVEGILLAEADLSSIESSNVGVQVVADMKTSIINKNQPVDIIARLLVDSKVAGQDQALGNSYEITDITTVADVSGSLGGTHFLISEDGTDYYVWYDTGSSIDPAVGGRTGIQVLIDSNDTARVVAYKTAIEIVANTSLTVYQNQDKIRCVDTSENNITDASDVDAGFTISILTQGGGTVKVIDDLIQGDFIGYVHYINIS